MICVCGHDPDTHYLGPDLDYCAEPECDCTQYEPVYDWEEVWLGDWS